MPHNITNVISLNGITILYKKFIRNILECVLIIMCNKGCTLHWSVVAKGSIEQLKKKIIETQILALPNFGKVYKWIFMQV